MNVSYLHIDTSAGHPGSPKPSRIQQILAMIGRTGPALLLLIVAVANVLTVLTVHPLRGALFFEQMLDLDQLAWGRIGALFVAILLVVVARALVRGKRHAWWLAVGLCAFSIISVIASHAHTSYLLIAFGAWIGLLLLAPLFPIHSDPRALWRGYIALGLSLTCLLCRDLIHQFWHRGLAHDVLHLSQTPFAVLMLALHILLFLFLGYGVLEILRPVLVLPKTHQADLARATEIVQTYGKQSMAHFALIGRDKSYFWSSTQRSFLAYHLALNVALILGDPVGPDEEIAPLLSTFLAYCKRQDWQFAAYQISPPIQRLCRQWHLHAYKVGEEAVLPIASFTLNGKAGAPVRHSITRAKRDGIRVECWQGEPLPAAICLGMKQITADWMASHNTKMQIGFSMGRFPADWSQDLLTAVALDQNGELQAFVTWTPLYAGDGWSLDNMRRLAETTPGTMEMLIAVCIEWAQAHGYTTMSLGLAPLSGLDSARERNLPGIKEDNRPAEEQTERASSSWLERSVTFLHRHKLLLGNYSSLHFFKNKFNPLWEPRYLIVRDPTTLPRVLAALAQAHGYTWRAILRESGFAGLLSLRHLRRQQPATAISVEAGIPLSPVAHATVPPAPVEELVTVAATAPSQPLLPSEIASMR